MKKLLPVVIVLVVVAIGAGAYVIGHKSKTTSTATTQTKSSSSYVVVNACDVLTSSAATQVMGATAVKGTSPAGQESTSDINFSECIYTAGPNVDPPHVVSVAVRSAKDSAGAATNKAIFTPTGHPGGTQSVTGYGDNAYWDPSLGQLNILKGNNWYIVTNYTGTSPANGTATLAMAEQLAQALKF